MLSVSHLYQFALLGTQLLQVAASPALTDWPDGFTSMSEDELVVALGNEPHANSISREDLSRMTKEGFSCSESKPCKIGCCGVLDDDGEGKCGSGPKLCGKDCISQCDWKSQCDPGWGMEYASSSTCPLNVCCSKFGFCGITEAFCRGYEVDRPSCPGGKSVNKRTVGYYQAWNSQRPCGKMTPEEIPLGYYSHINFAFAFIDPDSFQITGMSDETAALYKRVLKLKQTQPNLQVWISVGGGAMNSPGPWQKAFSVIGQFEHEQETFIDSLLYFMDAHGFDGVDLNWEYPGDLETGRLDALGRGDGLSITLPTSYKHMKGYNIKELEQYLDWFNVMTYDFHGIWDVHTPTLERQVYAHTNLTEIETKLDILWRNNISASKVVMGLAFYGRSFTMSDSECKAAGCVFSDAGKAGECTNTAGILSAREIKDIIKNYEAVVSFDAKAAVKTVTWDGNQWVGYDDAQTLKLKLDYANSRCLAGTMIWSIDMDDGTLSDALA
ncbi:Chitinase-3-like protein 1 [Cladobotryum mycophilum]|uniref:chitinase n=1 Tax=Cladobotryum mycophilum TaxID=491253 RepID=A0ABR0SGI9_9HYPO